MSTQSSVQAPPTLHVSAPSGSALTRLWERLIEPTPEVVGDKRRRARTLAALTAVLIPLAIFTILVSPIANALKGEAFELPSVTLFVSVVLIVVAYFLSRTNRHEIGAYLTIIVPFVAVVGSTLTSENPVTEATLLYLGLSVILSSLLLDSRGTMIAGSAAFVLSVLLQLVSPPVAGFSWPTVTFILISTSVMAVVSGTRDKYIKLLEATQEQLEQRIIQVDQARAQAERSDQVKSAFLASMSHELRTPLNAIINFTKFVVKGELGPINTDQQETLSEVVDSAKHLLNLINDVLDMSKIESGSLNLFVTDDIDLRGIITQVVTTGKSLLDEKPVTIETQVVEDLPTIRGDRQRLVQILLNIISNACKFTDQGSIKVSARRTGDQVVISVADTGPGIALEDQGAVFEAFKQTTSGLRQGGGTGLGMPISKNLVKAHGGELELESQPGKGTTFIVTLPVKSTVLEPTLK